MIISISVEKGVKQFNNLATDPDDLFAKNSTVSKVLVRVSTIQRSTIIKHKSASGNEKK